MNIINNVKAIVIDVKAIVNTPDEFVKKKTEKALCYSIALKVIAFAFLIFHPHLPILFLLNSAIFFTASIFIDHYFYKNAKYLFFMLFENMINSNQYEAGYLSGQLAAKITKSDLAPRIRGFNDGFRAEWNSSKK